MCGHTHTLLHTFSQPDHQLDHSFASSCTKKLIVTVNMSQGATIKRDEHTGAIIVARIMRGGAADRSGKQWHAPFLQVLMICCSVNLVWVYIKYLSSILPVYRSDTRWRWAKRGQWHPCRWQKARGNYPNTGMYSIHVSVSDISNMWSYYILEDKDDMMYYTVRSKITDIYYKFKWVWFSFLFCI